MHQRQVLSISPIDIHEDDLDGLVTGLMSSVAHGQVVLVPASGESIFTTPSHPFLGTDGWIPAGLIANNDLIQTLGGSTSTLSREIRADEEWRVFGLEVHGLHEYCVGVEGFVVHNDCDEGKKREIASEGRANEIHRRVGRELGPKARKELHDLKEAGMGDRTLEELLDHARSIYENAEKEIPKWQR